MLNEIDSLRLPDDCGDGDVPDETDGRLEGGRSAVVEEVGFVLRL